MIGIGVGIPQVALTPNKGVPLTIVVGGVAYSRAQDDDGAFLADDDGSPLYIEV